jgi:hypothetical protein
VKAKPVFAGLAEPRPADRPAQRQLFGLDPGLFADLAPHARDHIFAAVELAAQAVVFAVVNVVRPGVAMDQQHVLAIGRKHVAERR